MNILQNINTLRSYFQVTETYTFFNNTAESPMNALSRKAVDEFYDLAYKAPQNKLELRSSVREQVAHLLGGQANEYALVTSIGIVASGIKWQAGDNIVLPDLEHRNNYYPWQRLQEQRVEIRLLPDAPNGHIKLSDFEFLIDKKYQVSCGCWRQV